MSKPETLWYTRCGVPTPAGIAIQLGWIEEEFASDGIKIESIRDSVDRDVRQSHFDHTVQDSFRQGGSVPAIWARAAGRKTRLLGLTWTDEAQVILVSANSGVRDVKELKGRRLGIATRPDDVIDFWKATTLRTYLLALEHEGVSEKDVEFVDIPRLGNSFDRARDNPQNASADALAEVEALTSGKVDAIFHKGSRGLEVAAAIGARVVFDTWNSPEVRRRANNHSPRTLTADSHLVDNYPEITARIVRRVLEAGQWAEDHAAEAIRYVASETGSPERWVRDAYGNDVNRNLKTDLEESSIAALSDFTAFLFERGFLPQSFDVRSWIDPRPLAQAKKAFVQKLGRVTAASLPSSL
jgi:ABC-type nitrate/sulfonate/bicarbonate transport system substrate-binding protein